MNNDEKNASDAGPMNIASIYAGFEKGDFMVREEQGNRMFFDFFEEVGVWCFESLKFIIRDGWFRVPGLC